MKRLSTIAGLLVLFLGAGPGHAADYQRSVVGQLQALGYRDITINRTLLGRTQITANQGGDQREIILNPRTGEILRDYSKDFETGAISVVPAIIAQTPQPQPTTPVAGPLILPMPAVVPETPAEIAGPVAAGMPVGSTDALGNVTVETIEQTVENADAAGDATSAGGTAQPDDAGAALAGQTAETASQDAGSQDPGMGGSQVQDSGGQGAVADDAGGIDP